MAEEQDGEVIDNPPLHIYEPVDTTCGHCGGDKDDDWHNRVGAQESEESILNKEPWRSTEKKIRAEYVAWAGIQHLDRQSHGIDKYGYVQFQGDPIDQGIEENLDQLFYLYWAKKQLAFVEGQRNNYRHLLESVMEFGLSTMLYEQIVESLE